MSDDELQAVFAATEHRGRRVPPKALLRIERTRTHGYFSAGSLMLSVSCLVPIREEGEPAYRPEADVAREERLTAAELARAVIDTPPMHRPFRAIL